MDDREEQGQGPGQLGSALGDQGPRAQAPAAGSTTVVVRSGKPLEDEWPPSERRRGGAGSSAPPSGREGRRQVSADEPRTGSARLRRRSVHCARWFARFARSQERSSEDHDEDDDDGAGRSEPGA